MKKITYQAWESCGPFYKSFGKERDRIGDAVLTALKHDARLVVKREYKYSNGYTYVDDVTILDIGDYYE